MHRLRSLFVSGRIFNYPFLEIKKEKLLSWHEFHIFAPSLYEHLQKQTEGHVDHWLLVPFRIRYKLNSITSNCLAGRAPEYLIKLCHSVTDIPARRNLRSSSQVQLLVPRYRKEQSGERGFSVSSPQL